MLFLGAVLLSYVGALEVGLVSSGSGREHPLLSKASARSFPSILARGWAKSIIPHCVAFAFGQVTRIVIATLMPTSFVGRAFFQKRLSLK